MIKLSCYPFLSRAHLALRISIQSDMLSFSYDFMDKLWLKKPLHNASIYIFPNRNQAFVALLFAAT